MALFGLGRARGATAVQKEQVTDPARVNPGVNAPLSRPLTRISPQQLRRWADTSEWVRAAINHRRVQVSSAQWSIEPIDPAQDFDPQEQALMEMLFLHPNPKQKNFRALVEPMVEDLLVLDAGVAEKESNLKGLPIALYLVDGATIRIKPLWNGDPQEPRYEWWPRGQFAANLLDAQIIYLMANPRSHSVLGFSALEALKATIDADLEARDFNTRNVRQTNPHGIFNLGENIGPAQVDAFKVYWDSEVAGRRNTAIVGGAKNPQFINMGLSAREMQYMQWQVYLLRKIAAVFGIAPQDLGITFDVNRANAQTQQEISEDRGLRPLLRLVEGSFNTQVIAQFAQQKAKALYYSGQIDLPRFRLAIGLTHVESREHSDVFRNLPDANVLNLAFRFRFRTSKSSRDQAELGKTALGGLPWITINEWRAEDGRDPVENGDTIIVPTPVGPMPLDMITGEMPVDGDDNEEETPESEADEEAARTNESVTRTLRAGQRAARRHYVESLFSTPPVIISSTLTTPEPARLAPQVIVHEVEVDEYGDEIDD